MCKVGVYGEKQRFKCKDCGNFSTHIDKAASQSKETEIKFGPKIAGWFL